MSNEDQVQRSASRPGLMQLMSDTWAVLRELYDRFGPGGFLAAYNASPERYLAYLTLRKPLTDEARAYLVHIAPLLGDTELGRVVASPGTSPNWQAAPLFVVDQDLVLEPYGQQQASQ
jgi:hypothetical protein